MTDNDFLGLVSNEFDFCISSEEIQLCKKAILTVAKKLKVEDKKCKEIIKRTVVEEKADFGIAFDGDSDRIGVIDSKGNRF